MIIFIPALLLQVKNSGKMLFTLFLSLGKMKKTT